MLDNRVWTLGRDGQFRGYVRHTSLYGGQHLARLTWSGSGKQVGLITGHLTPEAAHAWLEAQAAQEEEHAQRTPL
jgi:hypothetical protein